MRTWRGGIRRRWRIGPSGATKPSTSSPAWDSASGSATCGGSLTCVRLMEEVSSDMLSRKTLRFKSLLCLILQLFFPKVIFFFLQTIYVEGNKLVSLFDEQIVQVNILIDLPHKV